ncbi:MAG: DinB family protein [Anaerolineales bacterium]|nr:DinB family protein [Anaerolineales bacterium]
MQIDFTPVKNKEISLLDFSARFSIDDLKAATHTSIDTLLEIIGDAADAELTFIPYDPHAHDPYATDEEQYKGWSLAHLVLHVCASCEEGAAFSSILARGIEIGGRLRYEPDWQTYTTREQVLHRLEESRRMRLAYLDTWPDEPHLDTLRQFPEDAKWRPNLNAKAAFLSSLWHEIGHYEQFRDAANQAREAIHAAS